jgi:hypothetical protein
MSGANFKYDADEHELMSFTGVDIEVAFLFPPIEEGDSVVDHVMPSVSDLSISAHREKYPVRAIGNTAPKGYTYGPRTIAGTLVLVNPATEGVLEFLQRDLRNDNAYSAAHTLDELPPFNMIGLIQPPSGAAPLYFTLTGVTFVDNGVTLGVNEGYTETVVQYMALDLSEIKTVLSADLR